jgi:hypothetical protein
MLAQLKTVVLIKEAIQLRNCQESEDLIQCCVLSLHRRAQSGYNQNRKRSGRPRYTTEQEDKYISVWFEKRLTSPQLTASLNSTRKTAVSTSTVKRRLWDAGLLGRVPLSSLSVNSEEATLGC